jgi:DNA-binding transcriptional regulator LsrR (DeoR family)
MSITENIRMTIKVCQLYYEENLSQKEISSHLGISRPQISRLLSYARQQHIVTIKINKPVFGRNPSGAKTRGTLRVARCIGA